jgi:hypothetical protein
VTFLLTVGLSAACAAPRPAVLLLRGEVPTPADGRAYLGMQLDWSVDNPASYRSRLGRAPALFGEFADFPLSSQAAAAISSHVDAIAPVHGKYMLTLQPQSLSAIDAGNLADLTKQLTSWSARGVGTIIRFGQEMNGSWYPWGQKPAAYIEAFRKVADAVHAAPGSVIIWSPNDGGGYPFPGGGYRAQPGTADFAAIDTNHDGVLTIDDDPYGPYYPGDDAVDWVGLSLYHFGSSWPWGENEVPEAGKLVAKIRGEYNGLGGNELAVPDFYDIYANRHGKPMALAETSALYNTGRSDGASNYDIKSGWWRQVFSNDVATQLPKLKMVNWFEFLKVEQDIAGSYTDWWVTTDPGTRDAFRAAIPTRFILAP